MKLLNVFIWKGGQPSFLTKQKLEWRGRNCGMVASVIADGQSRKKRFPVQGGVIYERLQEFLTVLLNTSTWALHCGCAGNFLVWRTLSS